MPKHDRRFAQWTADRLIQANFLRERPLPNSLLARYAGHKPTTLKVICHNMRRDGRLSRSNVVNRDHPQNIAYGFDPLPDLLDDPRAPQEFTNAGFVTQQQGRSIAAATVPKITRDQAMQLLDAYILEGGGAKGDFLQALSKRIELLPTPAAIPPQPLAFDDLVADLAALHLALGPEVVNAALEFKPPAGATAPAEDPSPEPPEVGAPGVSSSQGPEAPDDPGDLGEGRYDGPDRLGFWRDHSGPGVRDPRQLDS